MVRMHHASWVVPYSVPIDWGCSVPIVPAVRHLCTTCSWYLSHWKQKKKSLYFVVYHFFLLCHFCFLRRFPSSDSRLLFLLLLLQYRCRLTFVSWLCSEYRRRRWYCLFFFSFQYHWSWFPHQALRLLLPLLESGLLQGKHIDLLISVKYLCFTWQIN